MQWIYGALTVTLAVVFVLSVRHERARTRNTVLLGATLVSFLLWLLIVSGPRPLLQGLLAYALFAVFVVCALVLPVAAAVNGVMMWRREGHRLANLLTPIAGVGLVTATTILLLVGPEAPTWLGVAAASILLVAAYIGLSFLSTLLYAMLYACIGSHKPSASIVVLGSGLVGSRVPPLLASRLDRAIELHTHGVQAGLDPVVVVSGGRGQGEEVTEAEAMRGYLREAGLPEHAILLEDRASTTEENLRFGRDVLRHHGRNGPVTAVTNDFHVLRTALYAHELDVPVDVFGSHTARYFLPSAFLREYVAILARHPIFHLAMTCTVAVVPTLVVVFLP